MEERSIKDIVVEMAKGVNSNFNDGNLLPIWPSYAAVSKFKSVRRAIRRGHVDLFSGVIYPNRPFNNKKVTRGRKYNELKKSIYGQLKLQ